VFGDFQWARAISPFALLENAAQSRNGENGCSTHSTACHEIPCLLKIPEHRSLLSIYVETVIDAAMHLSPMARERLDFRDDSGGSLKVWHCHEG
jgi:hypothetical protein